MPERVIMAASKKEAIGGGNAHSQRHAAAETFFYDLWTLLEVQDGRDSRTIFEYNYMAVSNVL